MRAVLARKVLKHRPYRGERGIVQVAIRRYDANVILERAPLREIQRLPRQIGHAPARFFNDQ